MLIKISRTDGGVSFMVTSNDIDVDAEIAKWSAASNLTATGWSEISPAEIPADRTLRNALKPDLTYDQAEVAALKAKAPNDAEILRRVLKAKGIEITDADLEAAKTR
ncbi:MAG: hypothetical protein FJ143_02515 [Deltaproteobacteria bacterium]|nr:hypothetical protein [Deltaproteobacteria bacterium]